MIDLKPACAAMIDLLAEISDAQLTLPTPCDKYRVEDLLAHVAEVALGFAALARKAEEPVVPTTVPRDVLAEHVRLLGLAWDEPAAWQGRTPGAGTELANELWGRIAFTEIVVHGWDLARAIDRPFALPEDTLRACLDHVAEFIPNSPVPELWGPAVPAADDAPLLDRIVAITGRDPRWTAAGPGNIE
ncbi:TIGR03086 family metal-binding protein [Nocardia sp. NPDC051832]|uniref:TIGR03086 family metal-binding protein n=1 Tax=Nocardia sp. NPDC051832 TaxID=3155673 RepID=UPI0034300092